MTNSSATCPRRQDNSDTRSFVSIPSKIYFHPDLTDADRTVLGAIVECAGERKFTAASVARLAKMSRKSPRSIREALARLKDAGVIWMMDVPGLQTRRRIILAWRKSARSRRSTPLPPPCEISPVSQIAELESSLDTRSGPSCCADVSGSTDTKRAAPVPLRSKESSAASSAPAQPKTSRFTSARKTRENSNSARAKTKIPPSIREIENGIPRTYPRLDTRKLDSLLLVLANPESEYRDVQDAVYDAGKFVVGVLGNVNWVDKIMQLLWRIPKKNKDHQVIIDVLLRVDLSIASGSATNPGGLFQSEVEKAWRFQDDELPDDDGHTEYTVTGPRTFG